MLEAALARGGPLSLEINRASALHRSGRYQEAVAASRQYLQAQPQGRWAAAARTNLGLSLRLLGDDEGAEAEYRQAIKLEPGEVLHYRNLAQLLMDQQRWAGALGTLESGLQHAATPEDRIRFLEALAYISAEEGRGLQALRSIQQAMALGGDGARIRYLHGRALALVGRLEESRQETLRVLELEPDNKDARQAMDLIDQALATQNPEATEDRVRIVKDKGRKER
jgi:Flp pilus assembly protein TadD